MFGPPCPWRKFLSTLPARGATDVAYRHPLHADISIHAPREGSDTAAGRCARLPAYFYPRSPRGERPAHPGILPQPAGDFYPRSPRGERPRRAICWAAPAYFYPRSPRGERHIFSSGVRVVKRISIHAPREGSDPQACAFAGPAVRFLSTLPARGATGCPVRAVRTGGISIHAPREGSDPECQSGVS